MQHTHRLRRHIFLACILGLNFIACSRNSSGSRMVPEPDITERLKAEKSAIDSFYFDNVSNGLVFAKLENVTEPVPVLSDSFPANTETGFIILKDSTGNIISTSEVPVSMSGDWYIVLTHYFDSKGKTFAFERQTNFFNSMCTDGVAYETSTEYYDPDFKLIHKEYSLLDEKEQPLQKDSCQFPYNLPYPISKNADDWLKISNIKTGR